MKKRTAKRAKENALPDLPELRPGDRVVRRAQVLAVLAHFGIQEFSARKMLDAGTLTRYALPGAGSGCKGIYRLSDVAASLKRNDLVVFATEVKAWL